MKRFVSMPRPGLESPFRQRLLGVATVVVVGFWSCLGAEPVAGSPEALAERSTATSPSDPKLASGTAPEKTEAALQQVVAQGGESAAPGGVERDSMLSAAAAIMREAGLCGLVTSDFSGYPQVRTMQPFPPEPDLTVWMGTRRGTRKLEQLEADPKATLYYSDPTGPSYVTAMGRVEIIRAPHDRTHHWNPEWEAFYDDGPNGDDYVLLRFVPERLEVMSVPHDIAAEPKGWKPAVLELSEPARSRR